MPNELDVGGIVMRIRADATGVLEGARQLEAAMAQMRASSDKAGASIEKSAAQEAKAVQGAEAATAQAARGMSQSHQQMGKSAEEASAMQAAAYAGIAAAATKMIDIVLGAVDSRPPLSACRPLPRVRASAPTPSWRDWIAWLINFLMRQRLPQAYAICFPGGIRWIRLSHPSIA